MVKGMRIPCIVTGKLSYFSKSQLKKKVGKFGSVEEFQQHYVCPPARKLLRSGMTVDEVRTHLQITEKLPAVSLDIIARLKLLKKKSNRKNSKDQDERQRYLNSREFKDKMLAIEEQRRNMTFQDWVETYTSPGRERGGTCQRPDIFLTHNDRACDGCKYYEYCMCYGKRLSHEKKKPKRR